MHDDVGSRALDFAFEDLSKEAQDRLVEAIAKRLKITACPDEKKRDEYDDEESEDEEEMEALLIGLGGK